MTAFFGCECIAGCEDGWAPHVHDDGCLPGCYHDEDPDCDVECLCEDCHGPEAVERDHGSLRSDERSPWLCGR